MILDRYILSERPLKTSKRRSMNHRRVNFQEDIMTENRRRIRRGHSADNLDTTEDSTHLPASKENTTPSCPSCCSASSQFNSLSSKQSAKIPPETRTKPSTRHQQISTAINRNRPATINVMASSLQRSMRENAQRFCQRVVRDKGVEGLKAEFTALKKPNDPNLSQVFSVQPAGTRNRYRDVVCLDKTRVVLKNTENDYIHANYVSAPQNEKRFICSQGPTDSTCGDFWRMVVQERSLVVIMLCNIFEKQMKKCSEYFPTSTGQTLTFENMTVTCRVQKIMELPKECNRGIVVKISGLVVVTDNNHSNPHYVDHYQWIDWPDRGVPPTDMTAVNILNAVRPCKFPIVIHCSAGIGRTGSLVMMEYILELFLAGKPFERSDEILSKIREQRSACIQTAEQYLYVHRVLLDYFFRLNLLDAEYMPHIKKFVDDYTRATQC